MDESTASSATVQSTQQLNVRLKDYSLLDLIFDNLELVLRG